MYSLTESTPWRLIWSDALSFGIPEIDAEHKHFIIRINELNGAISSRRAIGEIRTCVQAIIDDALVHFSHEEALFKEWNYPEAVEHARKHVEIIVVMHEIMGRFERDCTEYELIAAGLHVKATLIEHFLVEDMKYRNYFLERKKSENA